MGESLGNDIGQEGSVGRVVDPARQDIELASIVEPSERTILSIRLVSLIPRTFIFIPSPTQADMIETGTYTNQISHKEARQTLRQRLPPPNLCHIPSVLEQIIHEWCRRDGHDPTAKPRNDPSPNLDFREIAATRWEGRKGCRNEGGNGREWGGTCGEGRRAGRAEQLVGGSGRCLLQFDDGSLLLVRPETKVGHTAVVHSAEEGDREEVDGGRVAGREGGELMGKDALYVC